jgi:hypothetical protein
MSLTAADNFRDEVLRWLLHGQQSLRSDPKDLLISFPVTYPCSLRKPVSMSGGAERVVSIVGTDEVDLDRNHINWVSPVGRALMKSAAGDSVVLQAPSGTEYLAVMEVRYERISVEPFREPPGSEASAMGLPRSADEEETKRHR